jgi:hypothetical protein
MTENTVGQVSYHKCVLKKSKQVYTLFFKSVFEILNITIISLIIIGGIASLIYIIYTLWQEWYLITEKLPPIPEIPWYVYAGVMLLLFPLMYSVVWCLFKREVKE